MKPLPLLALTLGFILCTMGCSPDRQVSGQVFVVTKGRENVKMGLVRIHAVTAEQLAPIAAELLKTYKQADLKERQALAQQVADLAALRQFETELGALQPAGLNLPEFRAWREESAQRRSSVAARDTESTDSPATLELRASLFARLPAAAGKTDADGRFNLKLKSSGKVWLLAQAERTTGKDTEHYFWAHAVKDGRDTNPVLLSNDSLVERGLQGFLDFLADNSTETKQPLPLPQITPNPEIVQWAKTSQASASLLAKLAKDKVAAEAKVIAEAKAFAEKQAAEAKVIAEAKAEAERVASEAKAEAERLAAAKLQLETDTEERRRRTAGEAWAVEGVGVTLVPIAGGTFSMGSMSGFSSEQPVTTVTLSPFWLAKTEVTQAQWEAVMGSNPSRFKGGQLPVENVSWGDAMEFCRKLTERERQAGRLPTGTIYTLPTEAQWEYACRAGRTGDYAGEVDAMAWYDKNSGAATHAVGTKQANAWGLHDMHGNVWEWCLDRYGPYLGGRVTDPKGVPSGSSRVLRGGSWADGAGSARSANRFDYYPGIRYYDFGFRLARSSVP